MDTSAGGPNVYNPDCQSCTEQSNFTIYRTHPKTKGLTRFQILFCKGCMYENKAFGGPSIKEEICHSCHDGSEYEEPLSEQDKMELSKGDI